MDYSLLTLIPHSKQKCSVPRPPSTFERRTITSDSDLNYGRMSRPRGVYRKKSVLGPFGPFEPSVVSSITFPSILRLRFLGTVSQREFYFTFPLLFSSIVLEVRIGTGLRIGGYWVLGRLDLTKCLCRTTETRVTETRVTRNGYYNRGVMCKSQRTEGL